MSYYLKTQESFPMNIYHVTLCRHWTRYFHITFEVCIVIPISQVRKLTPVLKATEWPNPGENQGPSDFLALALSTPAHTAFPSLPSLHTSQGSIRGQLVFQQLVYV